MILLLIVDILHIQYSSSSTEYEESRMCRYTPDDACLRMYETLGWYQDAASVRGKHTSESRNVEKWKLAP